VYVRVSVAIGRREEKERELESANNWRKWRIRKRDGVGK